MQRPTFRNSLQVKNSLLFGPQAEPAEPGGALYTSGLSVSITNGRTKIRQSACRPHPMICLACTIHLRASAILLSEEFECTAFHLFRIHVSASLASNPLSPSVPQDFFLAAESDPLALLALAPKSAPEMAAAAIAADVDCIVYLC